MKVKITRFYQQEQTIGVLTVNNHMMCQTLELPWKNNQRGISCIPEGTYQVTKEPANDRRPYNFFRIHNVPNRSGILIHKITYVTGLKGCIGVGKEMRDINKDNIKDMIRSGEALNELWQLLPDKFELTIV